MIEDGADIIDVGGESTRPGSKAVVSEKEEGERIVGVIKSLKEKHPDCLISVDTYKAAVARAAFNSGAEIVNDVSGFRWDPAMKKTLSELKCGAVLMHSRGRPDEWAKLKPVPDIVTLVKRELREWADAAQIAGIKRDRIVLDPGFGFGKKLEENYPLLKRFEDFHQLRYPWMVGVSRKAFIGHAIARNGTEAPLGERLYGTLGAEAAAIMKGAHVIRTHDVRACVEAAKLADVAAV
jgi:dihydropteroate synthase